MKKLLISILSVVMGVSLALGIAACGKTVNEEEVATKAIDTIKMLYDSSAVSTPDNYTVIGQTKVDDAVYKIDWSVSPESAQTYVQVGAMDESSKMVTIGITRTTVDVDYTLTASVTVGKVTKTADFTHKIPKKSSEDAITATLDLTAAANRTKLDTDNNEQVWQQNGVTLTNTGNVADYVPIRLYKNTTVEIEMENAKIIHIDFHSAEPYSDDPYPERLKTSIENSDLPIKGEVTLSEDGLTISVDFETPQEIVKFKATEGQCRLTSIDVEAIERDPDEHVHKWTYEHIEGTWTHTATCTAEGCDVKTKTEACTPKLNVCECGYTYSAKEIVDALFALEKDQSLPGTYSLTGTVTKVTEVDTTQYKNATFEMTVEGQTVTAYRVKGSHYAEVKVGGIATVNGELLDFNGTKEFTMGGSVVAFTDERNAQQKVDAALQALADTFTVTKAGETDLPASTEPDVTFAWSTTDQTYTITGNKINVSALPAADATVTATVTATCGTEAVTNNTKTVTITIRAESTEPAPGSGDGTVDHPYSVAEATEIIAGLGTETVYKVNGEIALVYVKGIVTVKGKTDNYGIKEYFMADVAGDTENDISVYSLNWGTVKKGTEINVGDTIIVTGYLQNFNGTYEVSSYKDTSWHNGTVEAHTPVGGTVTPPTPSEEVKLPDGDVKLDFSSVTEKGTEITSGDATDYFKGFTESADLTAAAVTEKVYKGNGTGGGDYENQGGMIKLGTSKLGATITLTFAKNVTKVVIMAQGWPGKSDTLAVNDGTAQTMSGSEKALYTFELTASAKKITITSNLRAFIFGIAVTFESGTTTPKTDAEKLADAKAALKLSKTELSAVGDEVELPATQGDASVTYELSAASDLVKIEGGKLTVLKLPESDTEITIKATLTVGQETDNVDLKVTVKAASTEPATNYGTLEDPLTVAEALALAKTECATQDDVTKELVYVTGVALTTPENKGSYYGSVEIADAGTQTKILIYSVSVRSGVVAPAQNDVLVVCGYIKNYYGTIEFATNNNIYVYIEKNTRGESTITLGEHAGATVTGLEEGLTKTNGTEVSFTVTAEQGKKIVAVKANGETLKAESENTYKFTVEGNMTITVETAGESEAVAELLYSLNSNEQPVGMNNNYANTCQVTYNGVTWVVAGNAKVDSGGAQKPWRFGGKNITAVDRALTGKTAISGKVTKITLQLTDGGSITVNSVTLKVYKSDPTISGAELVSTKDIAYQKGVAVDIMAGEDDWTNCFFQIVFNVTVGSSNKYVSIDTLEFYGTPAAAAAAAVSAPAEVAVLPGKQF